MKNKKISVCSTVIALLILCGFWIWNLPRIGHRTWTLTYAQQTEAPYFVVAHGKNYTASNIDDPMHHFSKHVELTCEAKDGKLLFAYKTNGKAYEGSYKITSVGGRFQSFSGATYTVVIDGVEGTAKVGSGMLFLYIDGYSLLFESE